MSGGVATGRSTVGGFIASLALIVLCAVVAFHGVRLWRFHVLEHQVVSVLASPFWEAPTLAPLTSLRSDLDAWADTTGMRSRARELSLRLGNAIGQSPSDTQRGAAAVLSVDPLNASAWMDLVVASWAASDRALAYEAWKMSSLVAPREVEHVRRRMAFILAIWPDAPAELKQRMFFELNMMFGASRYFGSVWRQLMAQITPDMRQQVDTEWRAYGKPNLSR